MGIKTPSQFKQMEYRWLLVGLAKIFKPHVYVEIGVKDCYTFNAMLPHVGYGVAVDINDAPISKECNNWHSFQMDSNTFALNWNKTIDFLFIDGDHEFQQVLKDVRQLLPCVREETGLIFLHDTYPIKEELLAPGYCNDAWKAADYLYMNQSTWNYQIEVMTFPGPWAGLTVIRKRKDRHGWMDKS